MADPKITTEFQRGWDAAMRAVRDWHEAQANKAAGIVINAGDISHRSIALHEALMAAEIPSIEVHTGNVHARDSFRHHSFTARAALATLAGFGIDGYRLAINGLAARIGVAAKA